MPSLQAVLETSLYVQDLDRAVKFYRDVLGLRLISEFENKRGVAFRIGESILLLFDPAQTAGPDLLPSHAGSGEGHVAFRVAPEDLPRWREHLKQHGIPIEKEFSFREQPPSIYFRDPDRNLLELAVPEIWPA
ncbi:MAG: VOC family protein [Acidobacteria bacterium]|nr:VOC family protein [Acidobacteriota bacterium]